MGVAYDNVCGVLGLVVAYWEWVWFLGMGRLTEKKYGLLANDWLTGNVSGLLEMEISY
jgi:hypothetical protein